MENDLVRLHPESLSVSSKAHPCSHICFLYQALQRIDYQYSSFSYRSILLFSSTDTVLDYCTCHSRGNVCYCKHRCNNNHSFSGFLHYPNTYHILDYIILRQRCIVRVLILEDGAFYERHNHQNCL